jgi:azurin
VKNYVRLLDLDTYVGREDWGIVDYNAYSVSATINEFSDSGTGFDINVTITNNEGKACNISVLALIMDMDAVTDDSWSDGEPYINGETIYPDIADIDSIDEAIQHTGTLGAGNSTTLTWSNVGTSHTDHEYKLWCNGGTATIN